ncbi:MAG: DUF3221 domain-containing protein [Streptococcaceae bacterium]|jgi:hypothetical protein|nr:DUF3221 domain-containing protein [Streptococcaceae bacterium]
MKKLLLLGTIVISLFLLVGCSSDTNAQEEQFIEGYFWHGLVDKRPQLSDVEFIQYATFVEANFEELRMGNIENAPFTTNWYQVGESDIRLGEFVRVYFEGGVAESYPAQIKVIKIEVVG